MALRELQKILANIVLLPGADVSLSLNSGELQNIFRDPGLQVQASQPPGQANPQIQITSLREQVVLVMQGGQIIIEDKSSDIPPKVRVPEIVTGLVVLLAGKGLAQYRSYGYNFHVVFDIPGDQLAGDFLAQRFINTGKIHDKAGIQVAGAGLRLFFTYANALCDFRLEPKDGKANAPQLFSSINYHYDVGETGLPSSDMMRSDFLGKWASFQQNLEGLVSNT